MLNGHDVMPGTANFVVSLKKNDEHFCSGCLISHEFILTAAQCIIKIRDLLQVNIWKIFAYVIDKNYEIENTETHPEYTTNHSKPYRTFDLGLIKVGFYVIFYLIIKSISE